MGSKALHVGAVTKCSETVETTTCTMDSIIDVTWPTWFHLHHFPRHLTSLVIDRALRRYFSSSDFYLSPALHDPLHSLGIHTIKNLAVINTPIGKILPVIELPVKHALFFLHTSMFLGHVHSSHHFIAIHIVICLYRRLLVVSSIISLHGAPKSPNVCYVSIIYNYMTDSSCNSTSTKRSARELLILINPWNIQLCTINSRKSRRFNL